MINNRFADAEHEVEGTRSRNMEHGMYTRLVWLIARRSLLMPPASNDERQSTEGLKNFLKQK
jgi:hypothetical protein